MDTFNSTDLTSIHFNCTASEALLALYNRSTGSLSNNESPAYWTDILFTCTHPPKIVADAEKRLSQGKYIDYWDGRIIKTDFRTFPNLEPRLYDRDNGEGKMKIIADEINKAHNA